MTTTPGAIESSVCTFQWSRSVLLNSEPADSERQVHEACRRVIEGAAVQGSLLLVSKGVLRRLDLWRSSEGLVAQAYATDPSFPVPGLFARSGLAWRTLAELVSPGEAARASETGSTPSELRFADLGALVANIVAGSVDVARSSRAWVITMAGRGSQTRALVRISSGGSWWCSVGAAGPVVLQSGRDAAFGVAFLDIFRLEGVGPSPE